MSNDQFIGTWSVFIPLTKTRTANKHFIDTSIDPLDLLQDKKVGPGKNLEYDPHITLHMGLIYDVELLRSICKKWTPFDVVLSGVGTFHNGSIAALEQPMNNIVAIESPIQSPTKLFEDGVTHEWDVLWRHVASGMDTLASMHKDLTAQFGKKWHFDEFKPHVTIAFFKYGLAEKYKEKVTDADLVEHVDHVVYRMFGDESSGVVIKLGNTE